MTAVALPRAAAYRQPAQRASIDWRQPEPWTAAIVLVTGVVILARHPLARMIGTAGVDTGSTSVVSAPPPAPVAALPTQAAAALVPVPTHAPRDPFRSLLHSRGKAADQHVAAVAAPAAPAHSSAPAKAHVVPGVTCAGTVHRVAAGDTLWSIAAHSVKSGNSARVTVAWHRIYAANRTAIGANPGLLPVGTTLCLPSSL